MSMEKENVKTLPMEALAELICLQTENGGTATLTVTGSSMMPMLHHQRDAVMLIQKAARQKKGEAGSGNSGRQNQAIGNC